MITFVKHLFTKKPKPKKVLEKININTPFEQKPASTTKKSRKKKVA